MSKLKSYNKKELADLYKVSVKTLSSWLKPIKPEIGEYIGRSFSIKQIQIIFNHLGEPDNENR
ncbi:MAG: hypothetical protein CVU05_02685 [Bacteroidetes bacterium HGW-Bacteroidetes-21]|jgi:phage terminase Nu1 subunit (DNA packaging protein)|nr:MAG: hypothetical protein CVU05_02685 [Bacteroidetes bacterium HGW-Bacteroidetes-21]